MQTVLVRVQATCPCYKLERTPRFGEPLLHAEPVLPGEALPRPNRHPLLHLHEPHERPPRRRVVHLLPGGRVLQGDALEVLGLDLHTDPLTYQAGNGERPPVLEYLVGVGYERT